MSDPKETDKKEKKKKEKGEGKAKKEKGEGKAKKEKAKKEKDDAQKEKEEEPLPPPPDPPAPAAPRGPRGMTQREYAFFRERAMGDEEELDRILAEYKGIDTEDVDEEARQWEELDQLDRDQLLAKFREEHKARMLVDQDVDVLRDQVARLEKKIPSGVEELKKKEQELRVRRLEVEHKRLELEQYKLELGESLRAAVKRYKDHAEALEMHVATLETDWDLYVEDRKLVAEETEAVRRRRCIELEEERKRMEGIEEDCRQTEQKAGRDLRDNHRRTKLLTKAIGKVREELGLPPEPHRRRVEIGGPLDPSESGSSYYTYDDDYYYYDDDGYSYYDDSASAGELARGDVRGPRTPAESQVISSEALRLAFDSIDKNGDGVLSKMEVIRALHHDDTVRRLLGVTELTEHVFDSVFQGMDRDGSKTISFHEFKGLILSRLSEAAAAAAEAEKDAAVRREKQRRLRDSKGPTAGKYLKMVSQVIDQIGTGQGGTDPVIADLSLVRPSAGAAPVDPEAGFSFPGSRSPPRGTGPGPAALRTAFVMENPFPGPKRHPAVPVRDFSGAAPAFASPRLQRPEALLFGAESRTTGSGTQAPAAGGRR